MKKLLLATALVAIASPKIDATSVYARCGTVNPLIPSLVIDRKVYTHYMSVTNQHGESHLIYFQ
jgi:hypothetical protein